MRVGHPHPPSPAGWAPPSPVASPSPALRERVPSAARRVRVPQHFVYWRSLASIDAEPGSSSTAAKFDRRRAAHVVGTARSPAVPIQVPSAAPDRYLYRRLRLHQAPTCDRNRREPTCGEQVGQRPNGPARKARLASATLLEQ